MSVRRVLLLFVFVFYLCFAWLGLGLGLGLAWIVCGRRRRLFSNKWDGEKHAKVVNVWEIVDDDDETNQPTCVHKKNLCLLVRFVVFSFFYTQPPRIPQRRSV
jgi:hypothetical protein